MDARAPEGQLALAGVKRENRRVRPELPTGTVTFLFTDIEGSTQLLRELGDGYAEVLAEHHRVLRDVWSRHCGVEVDTAGDSFFVAFDRASDAVAAAGDGQRSLADGPVRVRMGLHTGEPLLADAGYVGYDVHRAARIAAAGHGGQVLLSQSTVDLAGAEVRDLGLHRLKDLSAPERIFQLGTEDFPPLKTLHETNLPVPATPFLGREREVDELAGLLRRPGIRLVTLTGPGGSGKTRLALQAAAAAADDYESGVWWVPLASLADPILIESAASQALGSKDRVSAAVGDKRLLLLLDNFEHLLEAAPALAETIGVCPRLTVLVTSREPLHVDGEWEFAVDPLREQEAVALFLQRAAAVRSDITANGEVVEICRRLDCLPLAIELAAARVKVLELPLLLERLEQRLPVLAGGSRSAPERQRTLRATIRWSHELLTAEEQDVFARLAVFAGGCTLDASEAVCDADLDSIASLVDKSLLRRTGNRFWMLETIREFAAERLAELPDLDALRDRHAGWFIDLGVQARPELEARRSAEWLNRLDAEQANVRASLDNLLAGEDRTGALRLSGSVWQYWALRGHWTEGRRYLVSALTLESKVPPDLIADAAWGAAVLALWQDDVDEGERWATCMLEEARRAGYARGEAIGVHTLAMAADGRGELDRARVIYEEALVLARSVDDGWLLSAALNNLGGIYVREGSYEKARELFAESLAIGEARGDVDRRARELSALGLVAQKLGDLTGSRDYYRQSLTVAAELGLVQTELGAIWGLASYEADSGDAVIGARLLGWVIERHTDLGGSEWRDELDVETSLRDRLGPERLTSELAAGAQLERDDAIALALAQGDPR
jgi:predicted ATPase/class 3 adenylate cyclase